MGIPAPSASSLKTAQTFRLFLEKIKVCTRVGSEAVCGLCVTAIPCGLSNGFTMAEDSSLLREGCSVWGEHHSAVPAGLAIASPLAAAAYTGSVCHFHGSLSIDPTEQADFCFSS